MQTKKLFITQATIDKLSSESRVEIEGDIMSCFFQEQQSYKLTSAVKFTAIDSRPDDPHNLVGKIIPVNILKQKGVELYRDSAIYKDEAYKVEQGFACELLKKDEAVETPGSGLRSDEVIEENGKKESKRDDEMLADFLLKNL